MTLSSQCDMTVALMNSRQLWLSTQGLHTIEPVTIPSWAEESLIGQHTIEPGTIPAWAEESLIGLTSS